MWTDEDKTEMDAFNKAHRFVGFECKRCGTDVGPCISARSSACVFTFGAFCSVTGPALLVVWNFGASGRVSFNGPDFDVVPRLRSAMG